MCLAEIVYMHPHLQAAGPTKYKRVAEFLTSNFLDAAKGAIAKAQTAAQQAAARAEAAAQDLAQVGHGSTSSELDAHLIKYMELLPAHVME